LPSHLVMPPALEGGGPVVRSLEVPAAAGSLVADDIQRRTAEGEISAKLPSERRFAEEYGVAYTTVRHAMAVLRERGSSSRSTAGELT